MPKLRRQTLPMYSGSASQIVRLLNGEESWFQGLYPDWEEEKRRAADLFFTQKLKSLVDQWIDSGRDRQNPACHSMSSRTISEIPPGYAQSVSAVIQGTWLRIRPRAFLLGDGSYTVIRNPPPADPANIPSTAQDLAVYWMTSLLQTPGKLSLSRCENKACERYFEYQRIPKRAIKLGTYCLDCKGKASAVRQSESRERRKTMRVNLAAELCSKWEPRFGSNRSKWIAEQMNRKLSEAARISSSGKWVTQNRKTIDLEIHQRSNLKAKARP